MSPFLYNIKVNAKYPLFLPQKRPVEQDVVLKSHEQQNAVYNYQQHAEGARYVYIIALCEKVDLNTVHGCLLYTSDAADE